MMLKKIWTVKSKNLKIYNLRCTISDGFSYTKAYLVKEACELYKKCIIHFTNHKGPIPNLSVINIDGMSAIA